ncbi:MAG: hypothetical protein A3C84_02250 [Candidatus Ryanbacteria bacterium RIFCSPHIGHO2_02_FULL_48_12]|uniref:Uncharacterized protein n=1 Tax=Candidatus Ryanbacteria bacterium RIFCSPHIGHO2_01_FULL_48_27 TaxID=1802115 RepID=A0A1G2G3T0_9BACT|nr:MAG: hypothetical protein A2756_04675 [Candidatus Ryanbacteria bacterium RIFCSPHIGHO2_01_FULL_48_27]OGZ49273.1 MAG: hypothetical protein A3C84_02250 [Candidatus Ryanbacteria bacterium RIFCSPHIGHO2_02_FULL_48_12]
MGNNVPFPLQFAEPLASVCIESGNYSEIAQTLLLPEMAIYSAGTTTSVETGTGGHGDTDTDTDTD